MSPLKEIVDGIHVQVAKIDDDLKVRIAEYNNVRSQLNAINRKQTGSLVVRDLSNLVKPEDIITSEHLVSPSFPLCCFGEPSGFSPHSPTKHHYSLMTSQVSAMATVTNKIEIGR